MSSEKTLVGPYALHEKLGSHRRHHVYRAIHEETGAEVALKLVNISSRVDRTTALKKIQLEARILQRLDHPNLVKILDAGIVEDKLYFAMENVKGESLAAVLSRRGRLPWDLSIEYARQIASGLHYIHEQELVHLKLNPDKILLTEDGTLKVADLRLNRAKKRRWDETKRRVLDLAAYMAPEQMMEEGATAKSDLYGVGVLIYEMITGRLPFEPDTLSRLIKAKKERTPPRITELAMDCPVWIDDLVAQLLSADQSQRPHSTYALLVSLQEVQRIQATRSTVAEELTRGFNPLTAGKDKSAAFQVLGKKKERSIPAPTVYMIPMLFVALVFAVILTAGLFWFAMRPPSEDKLYANAVEAMEMETSDISLLRAKRNLEPLVEKYPDGKYAEEAAERLDQVIATLAERRMRRRFRLGREPRSEYERLAVRGWQLEEINALEEAIEYYEKVLECEDKHEDAGDYQALAKRKLESLEIAINEKEPPLDERRELFQEKLIEARMLDDVGQLAQSQELIRQLIATNEDDEEMEDLIEDAREMLVEEEEAEDSK